jgi:hypothetical protein
LSSKDFVDGVVSSNETMEEDGTREEEDNVAMHSSKVEPCF